ncbi:Maintenance of ploidy protein mob2 [Puccinia graminis f. sp. tritici]|uniref:Maintenance of ploidy protein mob2 n=1 Tax=Puccinia graminis f. sp. tritici TaxID=56615 RepID=A0A5B0R4U7_PUCGR|nr:Maintenance of ploidy protein mob2 [Puccinia graminis f. sp. tritici]KAA1120711.1 Maintenance of ploidy protein mob2 [Puccinia graminis f. sp. tritici]
MSFLNRVGIGSNKLTTNTNSSANNSNSGNSNGKPSSSAPSSATSPQQSTNKSPTSPVVATNSADPAHQSLPSTLSNLSLSNQPRAITPCAPSGKALYLCNPFVKAALVKGSFRTIVSLPRYCDVNEWVAVNLVDFFNSLNLILSLTTECCNANVCPTMSSGPGMDYTWTSMTGGTKKQVKVPAPQYIDYVMTWAEKLLADEATFPTKAGREFNPNTFPSSARHLYTQFLRIFAHLYHAHFDHFVHLSSEGHVNSLFAHFLQFGVEFDLIDPKELRAPKEGSPFVVGDLLDAWKNMGILTC